MARRIEDYALIGDCRTGALVGRDGSIDWLCLPRFDGGACFAALLGNSDNGRWVLAPVGKVTRTSRRYRGNSLILETDFETDEGAVRVVDTMPIEEDTRIVRQVVGLRGTVAMRMELVIRYDYGQAVPWVTSKDGVMRATAGPDTLRLATEVPLRGERLKTVADFEVRAGEAVPFVLTWHRSHYDAPAEANAAACIESTEKWWNEWTARCTYQGSYRADVLRSLITLKALTHARTGGIVAALTTSLPEQMGGSRNWDYRYCWLRDASFTVRAFLRCGYREEATAWRQWVLRAAGGDPKQLQIMYGIAGERRLEEMEIPWLAGFENSKPVRIGNAASEQLQLDVYGELLGTLYECYKVGIDGDESDWSLFVHLLETLEGEWKKPDSGMWEVRGAPRHFTNSKISAWLGFDRGIRLIEERGFEGPLGRWKVIRAEIEADVMKHGFDHDKNTFVQSYDRKALDASVLLAPMMQFCAADDPRMLGTVKAIEDELLQDGLVRRYLPAEELDGQSCAEGVFLPCSFWLVANLVRQDRLDEARQLYQRLLSLRNDVGLYSEEYDTENEIMLGNYPQAFTHLAMILSAMSFEAQGPSGMPVPPGLQGADERPL